MVARDPSRPKASQIPMRDLLVAIERRSLSCLAFPPKVVSAKLDKVGKQGFVATGPSGELRLSQKGKALLLELRTSAAGEGGTPHA
jgi:hypothetical protein